MNAVDVLEQLHRSLALLGFGDPDADISGAEAIDTLNDYWPAIAAAVRDLGLRSATNLARAGAIEGTDADLACPNCGYCSRKKGA